MRIRPALTTDAEAIRAIYNREVSETTSTLDLVPRTLDEQRRWIDDRSGALAALVAESDRGEVAGFASLSSYRDRPGYRTSVENSIYIAADHRRAGVGSLLLGELIDVAVQHGFHAMFARIVGPQPASLRLHEQHGFWLVGTERQVARKFGRWHDVALMQRLLSEPTGTGTDPGGTAMADRA